MRRPGNYWYLALLAVPLAIGLRWTTLKPVPIFLISGLGIIPLAVLMGRATETLASRLGPQFGGLLSATFGNAAELILGLVALRRRLPSIVRASLTGSIIGNALLVLGLSLLVGGLRHRRQTFDRAKVDLQATLLVVAAIGLTIPSLLFHSLSPQAEVRLSEEVAGVLLITYLLSLVFSWLTHERPEEAIEPPAERAAPSPWHPGLAVGVLAAATALVVLLSEFLVGAIESAHKSGALEALGMTELFVGVIVVAVVGNAAENSTAILMAYRNKIDLALHIAVGSSLQIALVVTPVLVFASLGLADKPLDLHFSLLELLAVGASVIVLHLVASDGQTHWMEGVLLLAVYLILAMGFYHFPETREG